MAHVQNKAVAQNSWFNSLQLCPGDYRMPSQIQGSRHRFLCYTVMSSVMSFTMQSNNLSTPPGCSATVSLPSWSKALHLQQPTAFAIMMLQDRLDTLQSVREAGISVCAGGIIGLGEGPKDRVGLIHQLATLPEHPESVPINALVAVAGVHIASACCPQPHFCRLTCNCTSHMSSVLRATWVLPYTSWCPTCLCCCWNTGLGLTLRQQC